MKKKNSLTTALALDVIAFAIVGLSIGEGPAVVQKVLLVLLAIVAVVLIFLLSQRKEIVPDVEILAVESVSQMNPGQYLSKGGPVVAGSDGRYHVTFLFPNDSRLTLSLSGKQAGSLAKGMRGTLTYRDAVYLSFEAKN